MNAEDALDRARWAIFEAELLELAAHPDMQVRKMVVVQ